MLLVCKVFGYALQLMRLWPSCGLLEYLFFIFVGVVEEVAGALVLNAFVVLLVGGARAIGGEVAEDADLVVGVERGLVFFVLGRQLLRFFLGARGVGSLEDLGNDVVGEDNLGRAEGYLVLEEGLGEELGDNQGGLVVEFFGAELEDLLDEAQVVFGVEFVVFLEEA